MKGKRVILIILILNLVLIEISRNSATNNDFQKTITEIKEINWEIDDKYLEGKNYTLFHFTIDYQINNPNNYCVNVSLAFHPSSYYHVFISWKLENRSIEASYTISYETTGWSTILTIEKGINNGTSTQYLRIYEKNIKTLPDGEYHFWIEILDFNEEYINSKKTLLTMKDGIQTIQYTLTGLLSLNEIPTIILCFILITIVRLKKIKIRRILGPRFFFKVEKSNIR